MGTRAKISFFCRQDFANVSSEIAQALRTSSETHDARVISLSRHPYNYALAHDYDLDTCSPEALKEACAWLQESEIVVWAEEATWFGDPFSAYGQRNLLGSLLASCANKKRFVFHAGCAYRSESKRYNPLDVQAFAAQLCSPDLLRLANPGARCVWGKPMTTDLEAVDRLWKARRDHGKIVVTHSPSSHELKGTAMFRRIMERVTRARPNVEYRELGGPLGQHLPHEALMAQRDAAVLCLDQYHPSIGGMGIQAYEAMTRGALPLASMHLTNDAAYAQWGIDRASFPMIPLAFENQQKANPKQTERALTHLVMELTGQPLDRLEERGRAAAQWTRDRLSPAAFAQTWLSQLDVRTTTAERAA